MAFFSLKPISIVFLSIGIALVVGVLVIVALKIFRQNKEEQQVAIAKKGMPIQANKNYKAGLDIAIGSYTFAGADNSPAVLTVNGAEKTLQPNEVLALQEDDVICASSPVVATICK